MNLTDKVEKFLEERNQYLWWDCTRIYFMVDLYTWVENGENVQYGTKECLKSESIPYQFMESKQEDDFHYGLRKSIFGLAEYLNKNDLGFDKNEVPLIKYEITKENQLLITCFIDQKFFKEHQDVSKKLEKWLNGQLSDGWGENGFCVMNLTGNVKEVNAEYLRRVVKKINVPFDPDFKDGWENYIEE